MNIFFIYLLTYLSSSYSLNTFMRQEVIRLVLRDDIVITFIVRMFLMSYFNTPFIIGSVIPLDSLWWSRSNCRHYSVQLSYMGKILYYVYRVMVTSERRCLSIGVRLVHFLYSFGSHSSWDISSTCNEEGWQLQ